MPSMPKSERLVSVYLEKEKQDLRLRLDRTFEDPKRENEKSCEAPKPSSDSKLNFQLILPKLKSSLKTVRNNSNIHEYLFKKIDDYTDFLFKVNFSNNLLVQLPSQTNLYKVLIKNGNNFQTIKQAFKKRWWWQAVDGKEAVPNCVWTPFASEHYFETLDAPKDCVKETERNFETVLEQDSDLLLRIFNKRDLTKHKNLIKSKNFAAKLQHDKEGIKKTLILDPNQAKFQYNHIIGGHQFCDKKLLFYNLKRYCEQVQLNVFDYMPVTFHVKNTLNIHIDPSYKDFKSFY